MKKLSGPMIYTVIKGAGSKYDPWFALAIIVFVILTSMASCLLQ